MKKHNQKIIILKLGGSIITEKLSRRARLKEAIVRQLAKELKTFIQRFPDAKIILLHGAGSFGHPLVHRYKLLKQPLTGSRLLGFTETVYSTRQMANLLTEFFQAVKLPVFPLQTSAMAHLDIHYLKQIVDAGFIPLLGGDMGLNKKNQAAVVSADKLAVLLAKEFPNSRIIFATNVNGVFNKFPPAVNVKPFPFLSRRKINLMLKKMSGQKIRYDVTGGMAGKLRTTLALQKKEIIIFNGLKKGNLTKALVGESIGTRLAL